jgi:hypothetical protein
LQLPYTHTHIPPFWLLLLVRQPAALPNCMDVGYDVEGT